MGVGHKAGGEGPSSQAILIEIVEELMDSPDPEGCCEYNERLHPRCSSIKAGILGLRAADSVLPHHHSETIDGFCHRCLKLGPRFPAATGGAIFIVGNRLADASALAARRRACHALGAGRFFYPVYANRSRPAGRAAGGFDRASIVGCYQRRTGDRGAGGRAAQQCARVRRRRHSRLHCLGAPALRRPFAASDRLAVAGLGRQSRHKRTVQIQG